MQNSSRAGGMYSVALVAALVSLALGARAARAQDAASQTLDSAPIVTPVPPAPAAENVDNVDKKGDRSRWGDEREINGARFLVPQFVDFALIVSAIGLRSGFELETTPKLPLQELGIIDVEQARIAETIDVQVRLVDRLALQLQLAGFGSSATTSRSLIARGADYKGSAQAGLLFELFRLRGIGTQLSLRGSVALEGGQVITLLPLLDQLSRAPIRTVGALLDRQLLRLLTPAYHNTRWNAALAAAQPINRMFSVQASAGAMIENIRYDTYDVVMRTDTSLDITRVTPQFGVAFTVDANAVKVPVALMVEYRLSLANLTYDRTDHTLSTDEHILAAGVYYSARADMQTGLVVYGQLGAEPITGRNRQGDTVQSESPSLLGLRYMLNYYW